MSTLYETEVREQPASLARLLAQGRGAAEGAAEAITKRGVRFALVAARGSSDNAARYGQYLFGIQNRLVVGLATPSVFTQYHAAPALAGSLVIGISQSGQSPDIVEVVAEARRQAAVSLALTNDPESPLARAAELVLPLHAGPELAVAATKTYTAQCLALAMLSAALLGDEGRWAELGRLPDLVSAALSANAACAERAARLSEHARMIVVGRGYDFSTALEITLKIKETSGVMADGYSSADFLHGPKALLDRRIPVLAVATAARRFDDLEDIMRLAAEKGAPLAAISDRPEVLAAARVPMPLPEGVPEWLSPIVSVVPGQLFALGVSLARRMQPDAPPGLTKVTQTR